MSRSIKLKALEFNQKAISAYELNFSVDAPGRSQQYGPYWLPVVGWIHSWKRAIQSVAIYSKIAPRHPLAIVPLSPRADVANYIKVGEDAAVVFNCMINTLGLSGEFELYLVPLFEKHDSDSFKARPSLYHRMDDWFARLVLTTENDSTAELGPGPAPIFITSLGRSGSTALYKFLGTSGNITAYDRYPCEARVAAYWLDIMRLTLSPADQLDENFSEQFLDVFREAQACPFYPSPDYPELASFMHLHMFGNVKRRFRGIIEDTYLGLSAQGYTSYFVEKSVPGTLTSGLAEECWKNSKEIILIRNPADWALSVKEALNKSAAL